MEEGEDGLGGVSGWLVDGEDEQRLWWCSMVVQLKCPRHSLITLLNI